MKARTLMDLTCRELVELATEYMSGALSARDRALFEQHLLICPPCTAYLRQLKSTIDLAGGLKGDAPPVDVERILVDLFRNWKRG